MIIQALNEYYQKLEENKVDGVPSFGFSSEKISYALVINEEGELVDLLSTLDTSGKKPKPKELLVPAPPKRSVNVASCLFWDKTSYVLGITASETEKDLERAKKTHAAFKDKHLPLLADTDDPGLLALKRFLENWVPERANSYSAIANADSEIFLDSNVVFRLDGELGFIHERPAAKAILQTLLQSESNSHSAMCLVTGETASVARLHPSIKGVNGAQSSGASLISFNKDSFNSYGKEQGDNAPISEVVAFGYGAALAYLLRRAPDNSQRLQIGDTTLVFWAQAESLKQVKSAESLFSYGLEPQNTDSGEIHKMFSFMEKVAAGKPVQDEETDLAPETKIFVLGLAPNASRLSVRFFETESLQRFSCRLLRHYQDLELTPLPWKTAPSVWRLCQEVVPHREGKKPESKDVPPQLAGELMRSILSGYRYPRTILTNIIMRFRADGDVSSLRVSLCKAVLTRDLRLGIKGINMEVPMGHDESNTDPGYLLGRLFYELENAQKKAIKSVNASIKERFYGAASASPFSVFPTLLRNFPNHITKLEKSDPESQRIAKSIDKQVELILSKLSPKFPKSLNLEAQGQFAIGYYHQRNKRFEKASQKKEGEE